MRTKPEAPDSKTMIERRLLQSTSAGTPTRTVRMTGRRTRTRTRRRTGTRTRRRTGTRAGTRTGTMAGTSTGTRTARTGPEEETRTGTRTGTRTSGMRRKQHTFQEGWYNKMVHSTRIAIAAVFLWFLKLSQRAPQPKPSLCWSCGKPQNK